MIEITRDELKERCKDYSQYIDNMFDRKDVIKACVLLDEQKDKEHQYPCGFKLKDGMSAWVLNIFKLLDWKKYQFPKYRVMLHGCDDLLLYYDTNDLKDYDKIKEDLLRITDMYDITNETVLEHY